jgi:prepilin-type processing-associated H-X9-DG protein
MSNLRQFGVATATYVSENRGFLYPCEYASINQGGVVAVNTKLQAILQRFFPIYTDSSGAVLNKGSTVWSCPSAMQSIGANSNPLLGYGCNKSVHIQYSYVTSPSVAPKFPLKKITQIHRPTQIITMGDVSQPSNGSVNFSVPGWYDWTDQDVNEMKNFSFAEKPASNLPNWSYNVDDVVYYRPRYRHLSNKSASFLFIDGHVQAFRMDEIKMKNFATAY